MPHKKPKTLLQKLNAAWLRYEYRHTTLAVLFMVAFVFFLDSALVVTMLGYLESLGYVGAFIGGLLSVSFFTAAPGVVLLISLAPDLNPFMLAIVAGTGATLGDLLIVYLFEEHVADELKPVLKRLHVSQVVKRLRHKYTRWILYVFSGIVLASPIPDEVGLALLGISHINKLILPIICFTLNTLGIVTLVLLTRAIVE